MKILNMRILYISLMVVIYMATGCSASSSTMSGTVVDAETGKPIEDAVVLVEWTKTKGLGLTYTESYKVVEVVTDKEGKFQVSGVANPFVNPPDIAVYKKGYVCWSSRMIFPDWRNRTDFKWQDQYVFKLEHFKSGYSYNKHTSFISSAISSGFGNKKLIYEAIDWEEEKALEERKKTWKK